MADKQAPMSEQTTKQIKVWTIEQATAPDSPFEYDQGDVVLVDYDELYDLKHPRSALSSRPEGPQERSELVKRLEELSQRFDYWFEGHVSETMHPEHAQWNRDAILAVRDAIAALSAPPAAPREPSEPRETRWEQLKAKIRARIEILKSNRRGAIQRGEEGIAGVCAAKIISLEVVLSKMAALESAPSASGGETQVP